MIAWKDFKNLRIFKSIRFKPGAEFVLENTGNTAPDKVLLAELRKIDAVTNGTPSAGKALVADANVGVGAFRHTAGSYLYKQAAPAAKTTSTTLTAAELLGGIITGNQGAAGAAAYTLPLATDLETALLAAHPGLQNDDSFDFNVINLSAVAAEDITVTTNTGWTLVGSMLVIEQAAGNPAGSNGLFRARRTAANAYTLYRIA